MDTTSSQERFSLPPTVSNHEVAGNQVTVIHFCWRGKTHVEANSECQDFAKIHSVAEGGCNCRLILLVADGVGTRSRSRKGAELACQALGSSLSQTSPERLSDRFAAGRDQFAELCAEDSGHGEPADVPAKGEKHAFQEYATTALVLCLEKAGYWAASVGDGAIYGLSDEGASAKLLTSINREGFANEVRPLTNNLWRQGFSESGADYTEDPSLCGFCLLTDGLSESIGDPGLYFGSVWPELRKRLKDPDALKEYSEAFCHYWEDGNFSDDDKTLLAVFLNP